MTLVPGPHRTAWLAVLAFWAILRRDLLVTARGFVGFAIHAFVQPLLFLFVFGVVLPAAGLAVSGYDSLLLPGIVALTVFLSAAQAVMAPLALDLSHLREIDDRLLAPTPIAAIVGEKIAYAALRGIVAAVMLFPMAPLVLGSEYAVRSDSLVLLAVLITLTAVVSAAAGLLFGVLVPAEHVGIAYTVLFTPVIFTGCLQYPWAALDPLPWFQVTTLLNPLTYSAEALRHAMTPPPTPPTLGLGWALLGLIGFTVLFVLAGLRAFRRRAIH